MRTIISVAIDSDKSKEKIAEEIGAIVETYDKEYRLAVSNKTGTIYKGMKQEELQ